ncbi:MAG: YcaQ family DNA glycosylase [Clostridiales bacterium]|nr:YcaQ family DNA glycosylase [Clostridiales bacterium]
MILTKKQARRIILCHLNLLQGKTLKGKDGIMSYIKKVGCLQFDPLNIIAMNPHLVLQSRIKDYKPEMLWDLLYKDRKLMDGWDKNMAIYPIEDRPYFKRYYDTAIETHTWRDIDILDHVPLIRKEIEQIGPVTSKDLSVNHKVDWSWAPTSVSRAVLDLMFFTGELIIYNKLGSRKVYDFSKNYLDQALLNQKDPNTSDEDYFKWGVLRRINSIGLMWDKGSEAWLGIRKMKSKDRQTAFSSLYQEGILEKFEVEGVPYNFYMDKTYLPLLEDINKKYHKKVSFIAALDNFIWDRKLISTLFDFNYKWEVYTPEKERRFGYYVLPILYGDVFIGRIEPVFDKKSKNLLIRGLWLNQFPDKAFKKSLIEFKEFLGATDITYGDKTPETLKWLQEIM